jgi:Na+/phosphate symporter
MLLALLLTAALDASSTCVALSHGFAEGNALYGAQPSCGRVVAVKAAGTGGAALLMRHRSPKARRWVYVALLSVNVVAVSWNVRQMQQRRR